MHNKSNAKVIRILLLVFVPSFSLLGGEIATEENRNKLGNLASGISPRIGEFIRGEGTGGDLSFDKSWLTRRLMISKGFEILKDYPVFGVGIGHYSVYQAKLNDLNNLEFRRLGGGAEYDEEHYNKKSAHNSYVHVASEMGVIGFGVLIFILLPVALVSLKKLYTLQFDEDDLILVSLIGICIHFYTIVSLPGTITWFVIGLVYARVYKHNYVRKPLLFADKKNLLNTMPKNSIEND